MFKGILQIVVFIIILFFFTGCEDNLAPYYPSQQRGKLAIIGYAADSVSIKANNDLLLFDENDFYIEDINKVYEFVSDNNQDEIVDILDYQTDKTVHTYLYTNAAPLDTISFFYKKDYFIDNVLLFRKGTLSQTGYTGYKFIFPNVGQYSNTAYDGPLDGIVRNISGQVITVAENITKESFSPFVEFPFGSPPVISMELVKHGTNEPYIEGQQIFIEMVMQNNKSKMIILEEMKDENGAFAGVHGTIDLTIYFDFQEE